LLSFCRSLGSNKVPRVFFTTKTQRGKKGGRIESSREEEGLTGKEGKEGEMGFGTESRGRVVPVAGRQEVSERAGQVKHMGRKSL